MSCTGNATLLAPVLHTGSVKICCMCTVFVSLILHIGDIDGAGLVTNSNVIEDDDFQGKPANSTSKELVREMKLTEHASKTAGAEESLAARLAVACSQRDTIATMVPRIMTLFYYILLLYFY